VSKVYFYESVAKKKLFFFFVAERGV